MKDHIPETSTWLVWAQDTGRCSSFLPRHCASDHVIIVGYVQCFQQCCPPLCLSWGNGTSILLEVHVHIIVVLPGPYPHCLAYAEGCLATAAGAELGGGLLDQESCDLFSRLVLQTPTLPAPRFSALVDDFGQVAWGLATSDLLLAYEL